MLEVDENLDRNMAIYQGIEKMLTPCCNFYDKKVAYSVQTTLGKFSTKKKNNLILNVSNFLLELLFNFKNVSLNFKILKILITLIKIEYNLILKF